MNPKSVPNTRMRRRTCGSWIVVNAGVPENPVAQGQSQKSAGEVNYLQPWRASYECFPQTPTKTQCEEKEAADNNGGLQSICPTSYPEPANANTAGNDDGP